ncbi:MAG: hypothetical protein SGJ19_07630 [Planctomycetia bacterium]|nr:hypothetical protein [Planctomycetia bacterium]
MSIDYGDRLANYAYKLIKDDVGVEFEAHLNEWKIHTNNLIQYSRIALNSFQTRLEDARKALEADRQRNSQMTMFVLSLLAGPALSFVGGALENRLAPKLFGHQHSALRTRANPKYQPPAPPTPAAPSGPAPVTLPRVATTISPSTPISTPAQTTKLPLAARTINPASTKAPHEPKLPLAARTINPTVTKKVEPPTFEVTVFDPTWAHTKGKILGDFGGAAAGALITKLLIEPAGRPAEPDQSRLQNAINRVPDSVDLESLKTNLENAWLEAQSLGKQAMQFYANIVRSDLSWGDRLWAKLKAGKLPGVRAGRDDMDLLRLGVEWIHDMVDQQRRSWAEQGQWFYYGNKPTPILEKHAINSIEAELWALWITQENFQPEHEEITGGSDREGGEAVVGHRIKYDNPEGRSRIKINKILPHLYNLGVVQGDLMMEQGRPYRAKHEGFLAYETTSISGEVDTEYELRALEKWAENRKPGFFGGNVGSLRRDIRPLVVNGSY